MKVGVLGVDRLDTVLAHQYSCLCIVHQVAAQMGDLSHQPCSDFGVPFSWDKNPQRR
jgi:hypothetical protein